MSPTDRLCRLDASQPDPAIKSGHLRLGGADPQGNRLEVTSRYLAWNGQPLVVISGEFHYSRYPEADWEEELLKLKAGGINTVATYVFWSFHEERPGVFDWTGQKNVRRFAELCARHGLRLILRIGPFAHGEWRNGGLPDWLYGQPFEVRSNDPGLLAPERDIVPHTVSLQRGCIPRAARLALILLRLAQTGLRCVERGAVGGGCRRSRIAGGIERGHPPALLLQLSRQVTALANLF